MKFSFELRDVRCNAVLSTEDDSPWGAEDGIRVYFLVATGSGARELRVSGRELPPPDLVDNYIFTPGKALDLRLFPPRDAASWDTGPLELSDGDNAYIAVVGVNEGLPWVGGGGGDGASGIVMAAAEEFFSAAAGAIGGPVGEAVVAAAFEGLNRGLEGLNADPECRGVAFAYNIVMSARHIFSRTVATGGAGITLHAPSSGWDVLIKYGPRRGDCGHPDYQATLRLRLRDQLVVHNRQQASNPRQGVPRDFPVVFERCAPDTEILVWQNLRDWAVTLQPSFSWPILIWRIEGDEIHDPNGSMQRQKLVDLPPSRTRVYRTVSFRFRASEIGGVHRLRLETDGDDGNYTINVALLLKFADDKAPVAFWEEELEIVGQTLVGNDAYYQYLACVERLIQSFRDIAIRYAIPVPKPDLWGPWADLAVLPAGKPFLWPARQILTFEHDMLQFVKTLRREFQMIEEHGDFETDER